MAGHTPGQVSTTFLSRYAQCQTPSHDLRPQSLHPRQHAAQAGVCAEIVLHVADEAVPIWQKTEEELDASGLPPPYRAFHCLGCGQALARHVLDTG